MFDIGWQELFIVAVFAIIVIGPKDLPRAMRVITKGIRKVRAMARDLQDGLDEVAREADLDDLKKEIEGPGGLDIAKKIGDAVDPTGEIAKDMDLDADVYDEMSGAVRDLKDATDPDGGAEADTEKADAAKADAAKADAAKADAPAAEADAPDASEAPKTARKASG